MKAVDASTKGLAPLPDSTPRLLPILDDEGLRDQATGEIGRRVPDAEHVGGKPLVIGRVAHFSESRAKLVPQEHAGL